MQKPTIVLLLTAAVIAAALAYARLRPAPPPVKAAVVTAPSIEPQAAPAPTFAPPAPSAVPPQASASPLGGDLDRNEQVLKDLHMVDTKFMSEPVTPRWAAAQENMIATALSAETLAAAKIPAPTSHEATCRSSTCRIKLNYKSQADLQLGQLNLLGAISGTLPQAIMGEVLGEDGSTQLVVYASPGRLPPKTPEPHRH